MAIVSLDWLEEWLNSPSKLLGAIAIALNEISKLEKDNKYGRISIPNFQNKHKIVCYSY